MAIRSQTTFVSLQVFHQEAAVVAAEEGSVPVEGEGALVTVEVVEAAEEVAEGDLVTVEVGEVEEDEEVLVEVEEAEEVQYS